MQGDIFELNQMAAPVILPKPHQTVAGSKPTSNAEVAIYNEDDLSHLLYVDHHHHHHHHHNSHDQYPFIHPADEGTILVNTIDHEEDPVSPLLNYYESCSGSESEGDVESDITPPSTTPEPDPIALDAYRRKGRRNAFSVAFEDGFEFPVFLGRQAEEWPSMPRSPPQTPAYPMLEPTSSIMNAKTTPAPAPAMENQAAVPASQHVDAISGPMMTWWPEPLEEMETDWTAERMEWELGLEKARLREREREGGIVNHVEAEKDKKNVEKDYHITHIDNIDGSMMSWWPAPVNILEHEWNDSFYE
ncbi:hypothetical protein F5Y19DRAFT_365646 [Xylariaceae sp. FL1651]|nr:hypothetical protein F5Y19DRAFT_365646 [Xylariaceae sp. FL1651]